MNILQIHNRYQIDGGEDIVVANERRLLQDRGHEAAAFVVHNDGIKGVAAKVKTALRTHYSRHYRDMVLKELNTRQPDVVHVHNFFPLLTPAVYDACHEASTPVVQTLHNYRTVCAGALLMRGGKICEKCIEGSPYHAVAHQCYRDSVIASLSVAHMIAYHRQKQTWSKKVNRFIALTQFAKQKFVQAGFDECRICVKPNSCPEPVLNAAACRTGGLFVGRISVEKGIDTLLSAWGGLGILLKVAGDGTLVSRLANPEANDISPLGKLPSLAVMAEMQNAEFLLVPSLWYEGFPMVIVEAFANGLPVICSDIGAMREIVENHVTGLHFEAGNASDLRDKVEWAVSHRREMRSMGKAARQAYLDRYSPQSNVESLVDIYRQAIVETGL